MRISTTRCRWPEVSPLRQRARRERLKYQASPVAMVRRKASAFMWATISTAPDRASVATQVTSPSASNLGAKSAPSSTSSVEPRTANEGELSGTIGSLRGTTPRQRAAVNQLRSAIEPTHHGDEANLVVGVIAKTAGKLRRDGRRTRLLYAPDRHAHVFGLEHHGNAARRQNLFDGGRDLRGHVLLGLQPARIDVDQAGKLGEAHDPVHRLVGDMRLAHERHHVVLAMGVEGDVAH